jgi:integrase
MPVKIRNADLASASARLKLKPRRACYRVRIAAGLALGYRRTESTFGTWNLIQANGSGKESVRKFADADDREPANGTTILDFDQAMDEARKVARGPDDPETANLDTIASALDAYSDDLAARGALAYNAERPRQHLGPVLLARPLALLSHQELTQWRNGWAKRKTHAPASINRTIHTLRAALELACPERSHVWKRGLKRVADADSTRNKLFVLADSVIRAIVAAAYARDQKLGEFFDVLAQTGTRSVQAARLTVIALLSHPPRLLMSKSAKGGGRNRAERKRESESVPISESLALRLAQGAKGRADHEPLLLRSDGRPWRVSNPNGNIRDDFAEIIATLDLDATITPYAFRHSSITRQLLRGVPTAVVAKSHNTSVKEIERVYGKYITSHADALVRAALLDDDPPAPADNVVALKRSRE